MTPTITHHATCTPHYPEKPSEDKPQQIDEMDLDDGYKVWTCVDCGAFVTDLPDESDPYWDEVRGGS